MYEYVTFLIRRNGSEEQYSCSNTTDILCPYKVLRMKYDIVESITLI